MELIKSTENTNFPVSRVSIYFLINTFRKHTCKRRVSTLKPAVKKAHGKLNFGIPESINCKKITRNKKIQKRRLILLIVNILIKFDCKFNAFSIISRTTGQQMLAIGQNQKKTFNSWNSFALSNKKIKS